MSCQMTHLPLVPLPSLAVLDTLPGFGAHVWPQELLLLAGLYDVLQQFVRRLLVLPGRETEGSHQRLGFHLAVISSLS